MQPTPSAPDPKNQGAVLLHEFLADLLNIGWRRVAVDRLADSATGATLTHHYTNQVWTLVLTHPDHGPRRATYTSRGQLPTRRGLLRWVQDRTAVLEDAR